MVLRHVATVLFALLYFSTRSGADAQPCRGCRAPHAQHQLTIEGATRSIEVNGRTGVIRVDRRVLIDDFFEGVPASTRGEITFSVGDYNKDVRGDELRVHLEGDRIACQHTVEAILGSSAECPIADVFVAFAGGVRAVPYTHDVNRLLVDLNLDGINESIEVDGNRDTVSVNGVSSWMMMISRAGDDGPRHESPWVLRVEPVSVETAVLLHVSAYPSLRWSAGYDRWFAYRQGEPLHAVRVPGPISDGYARAAVKDSFDACREAASAATTHDLPTTRGSAFVWTDVYRFNATRSEFAFDSAESERHQCTDSHDALTDLLRDP